MPLLQLRWIKDRCLGVDLVSRSHNTKIRRTQNSQIKQVWKYWPKFIYRECKGDEEACKGNTWVEGVKVKTWANKHEMYFGLKFGRLFKVWPAKPSTIKTWIRSWIQRVKRLLVSSLSRRRFILTNSASSQIHSNCQRHQGHLTKIVVVMQDSIQNDLDQKRKEKFNLSSQRRHEVCSQGQVEKGALGGYSHKKNQ